MTIETTSIRNCSDCGSILPTGPLAGLCPQCLLDSTLSAQSSSSGDASSQIPFAPSLPCRFAQYQLLEIVGRGSAGTVFRARDESLGREVAIKALHSGPLASRESIRRFFNEARVAARLSHPHIAPVYEVAGGDQVQPFVVMPFLPGGNLADKLKKHFGRGDESKSCQPLINTPLQFGAPITLPPGNCFDSFQSIAAFLHKIASAVHHAHQHGVLHRDLKPANILFDSADEPYVADFGLARVLEEESTLTLDNTVLGTPAYMSPEQATGSAEFTVASDIYSLGAILYELLTGRPPFVAPTIAATLRAIIEESPASMVGTRSTASQISFSCVSIPLDLQTICLKCLEKDPSKRYATAQSLADDLQRFLNNEPITARPITRIAKVIRWSQRNPALATAYSLLLLLLLVLLLGSPLAIYRINEARKAEAGQRARAQAQAYTSDMNLAQKAWDEGNLLRARDLLERYIPTSGQPDLRGFEWRYLWQLCREESLRSVSLGESISRLVTTPAHSYVAAACATTIRLLDPSTGQERQRLGYPGPATSDSRPCIALAARNTNVLAAHLAGGIIGIWDFSAQKWRVSFQPFTNKVGTLALSPDGNFLAAVDRLDIYSTTLALYDVSTFGAPPALKWSEPFPHIVEALAFSPDGRLLASSTNECIQIRDVSSGVRIKTIERASGGNITTLAFSSDGALLASPGLGGGISLWSSTNWTLRSFFDAPPGGNIAFSGDGTRILSSGESRAIQEWNVASARLAGVWRDLEDVVSYSVYSPDGQTLISAGSEKIKIWSAEPHERAASLSLAPDYGWPTISPNGRWLALSTASGDSPEVPKGRIYDLLAQRWQCTLKSKQQVTQALDFSPDGKILAITDVEANGFVGLWHTSDFENGLSQIEPFAFLTNGFECASLQFSPNGKILAVAGLSFPPYQPKVPSGATNRLAFWEVGSWKKLDLLPAAGVGETERQAAGTVAFSPDGRLLAVGHRDGTVRLWAFGGQRLLHEFKEITTTLWSASVGFSKDGRWLVSFSRGESMIILYNLADLAHPRVVPLTRDAAGTYWTEFAPDNKTLVTAYNDGSVHFWNLQTFTTALTVRHGSGGGGFLSLTPDGNLLVSKDVHGSIKFWPATSTNDIPKTRKLK